jgi:hypothetical protein
MHPALLALAAILVILSCTAGAVLAGRASAGELARLRRSLAEAQACEDRLKELNQQVSTLRHDLRGMLSPAMLVADRLLDNQDPGVKRAGEMVIRTVERMTARLAETKLGQETIGPPSPPIQ